MLCSIKTFSVVDSQFAY